MLGGLAQLVSSKYLTAFSDFRLPRDAPDFVTPQAYVDYLHEYVDAFKIRGSIECQAKVVRVSRGPEGLGHVLLIAKPDGRQFSWTCDAVAVCCGLHCVPSIPVVPGIQRVPKVLHSSKLKRREQLGTGTNVVVCGAGETGMDLAHLAVTSPTASVTLCHRDGFFCAPKVSRLVGEFLSARPLMLATDYPKSAKPQPKGPDSAQQARRHVRGKLVRYGLCPPRTAAKPAVVACL